MEDIIDKINELDTYYVDFAGCMTTDNDGSNEWIKKEDILKVLLGLNKK